MSLLGSVFLGGEGNYNINGIDVVFESDHSSVPVVFDGSCFGRSVDLCLSSSTFRILTFGYLHVFIHEMGHALASQLQGGTGLKAVIATRGCQGCCHGCDGSSFTGVAGPLAGVTLEVAKLVGSVALAVFLPSPIGLPLGVFIGAGASVWLFGELMYALVSSGGDWVNIARNGTCDYIFSLSTVVGMIALGCFATAMIL